ncbi:uncharacterized protein G2W53_033061 [Senna tora]|uniref:Uncharacterized protein n=1 Tax=Senna tora TaxID=362788 RepID=A0A834T022_9FABA|nr:uncharacterized protein G2W53_033061 [Senna tora]
MELGLEEERIRGREEDRAAGGVRTARFKMLN